jgi:hypothetical protein
MGRRHQGHRSAGRRGKKNVGPTGIYELLGVALGCIHLTYDDFCRLGFEEFAAVFKAYADQRDAAYRDRWERMRLLASIVIQPHLAKNAKITPERLLRFPWDKQRQPVEKKKEDLTPQQRRQRMAELVRRLEKNNQ